MSETPLASFVVSIGLDTQDTAMLVGDLRRWERVREGKGNSRRLESVLQVRSCIWSCRCLARELKQDAKNPGNDALGSWNPGILAFYEVDLRWHSYPAHEYVRRS